MVNSDAPLPPSICQPDSVAPASASVASTLPSGVPPAVLSGVLNACPGDTTGSVILHIRLQPLHGRPLRAVRRARDTRPAPCASGRCRKPHSVMPLTAGCSQNTGKTRW